MNKNHDIGREEPRPAFQPARCEIAREMKVRLELCPHTDQQPEQRREKPQRG